MRDSCLDQETEICCRSVLVAGIDCFINLTLRNWRCRAACLVQCGGWLPSTQKQSARCSPASHLPPRARFRRRAQLSLKMQVPAQRHSPLQLPPPMIFTKRTWQLARCCAAETCLAWARSGFRTAATALDGLAAPLASHRCAQPRYNSRSSGAQKLTIKVEQKYFVPRVSGFH